MSKLLENELRLLEPFLNTKNLIEVCINKPCEVWLETTDGWILKKAPALTIDALNGLLRVIANLSGQSFNDKNPILSTELPIYGYRLQALKGSCVDTGISIAIRAGNSRVFPLVTYCDKPTADRLIEYITQGKNILISGGTSTGKTTFLNSLIQYIPEDNRVITIENTKELNIPHENQVRLIKSKTSTDIAKISYANLIDSCMRLRPDRLLLGEIDVENTFTFLRILNTGHAGAMATLHANSSKEAIDALVMNAQLGGAGGNSDLVRSYALKGIDVIIQLSRPNRNTYKAEVVMIND